MKQDQNKPEDNNNRLPSNAANEPTPIYLNSDSTLQSAEEDRHDKSVDPRENTSMEPSNDDLHETSADRAVGSDGAGTAERKEQ